MPIFPQPGDCLPNELSEALHLLAKMGDLVELFGRLHSTPFPDQGEGRALSARRSVANREAIVGRLLESRRHQVVLATKGFFRMGHGPNDAGLSRATISPGRWPRPGALAFPAVGSPTSRSSPVQHSGP